MPKHHAAGAIAKRRGREDGALRANALPWRDGARHPPKSELFPQRMSGEVQEERFQRGALVRKEGGGEAERFGFGVKGGELETGARAEVMRAIARQAFAMRGEPR